MLNLLIPAQPVKPIDADLAKFVNDVLILQDAGQLEQAFAPIIAARNTVKPAVKRTAKPAIVSARKDRPTTATEHAYIRLVACELALMDAYADAPIDGYSTIDMVPTIGAVDAAYTALKPYCAAVDVKFGRGSAHYIEAAALVA
jgi:hypothetical protein